MHPVFQSAFKHFLSTLILQPLDRLKTLSQQDTGRRVSAFTNARLVVQRHGVIDLWRGSVPVSEFL